MDGVPFACLPVSILGQGGIGAICGTALSYHGGGASRR